MDYQQILNGNKDIQASCAEYISLEKKLEDFPVYADDRAGEKQRAYLEGQLQECFFALRGVSGLEDGQCVELINHYSENVA